MTRPGKGQLRLNEHRSTSIEVVYGVRMTHVPVLVRYSYAPLGSLPRSQLKPLAGLGLACSFGTVALCRQRNLVRRDSQPAIIPVILQMAVPVRRDREIMPCWHLNSSGRPSVLPILSLDTSTDSVVERWIESTRRQTSVRASSQLQSCLASLHDKLFSRTRDVPATSRHRRDAFSLGRRHYETDTAADPRQDERGRGRT